MPIYKFVVWSICLALALLLISLFVINKFPQYSQGGLNAAILVSWLSGLVAYALTYQGIDKNIQKFFFFIMVGMGAKMALGIISIAVVAVLFKSMIKEYVFTFFISYFVFTTFEVLGLVRKLRANF